MNYSVPLTTALLLVAAPGGVQQTDSINEILRPAGPEKHRALADAIKRDRGNNAPVRRLIEAHFAATGAWKPLPAALENDGHGERAERGG